MPSLIQDLYMIPFKLVEGMVYLIISVIILKRNKKDLLNQAFFLSILSWGIYILLDMILYPLAHFETQNFGSVTVNSETYVLPMVANILRDLAIAFAGGLAVGFLYATVILRYGEEFAKQGKIVMSFIIIYLGLVIPTILFDQTLKANDYVKSSFNLGSVVMMFAQILIFILGLNNLLRLYFQFDNVDIKKRIGFFILGNGVLLMGVIFFVLIGAIGLSEYAFITGPIGHTIWTLGAIFIYKGITRP